MRIVLFSEQSLLPSYSFLVLMLWNGTQWEEHTEERGKEYLRIFQNCLQVIVSSPNSTCHRLNVKWRRMVSFCPIYPGPLLRALLCEVFVPTRHWGSGCLRGGGFVWGVYSKTGEAYRFPASSDSVGARGREGKQFLSWWCLSCRTLPQSRGCTQWLAP